MSHLFWGLFFVLIDIPLRTGSVQIDLLPDFLGYFLLMRGMRISAERSAWFQKGRHGAFAMLLLSILEGGIHLMRESSKAVLPLWIGGLMLHLAQIGLCYVAVRGILECFRKCPSESAVHTLKALWLAQAVISTLCYGVCWIPLVSIFCTAADAVVAVCFLAAVCRIQRQG